MNDGFFLVAAIVEAVLVEGSSPVATGNYTIYRKLIRGISCRV
jgi:hypothetical protein